MQRKDNIVALHRGIVLPDYAAPRFVRPINPEELAQAMGDAGMLEALAEREPLWPTRHVEPYRPPTLADDWREFVDLVRRHPESYAIVGLAGFFTGLLLIIVPALIGAGMLS